MGIKYAILGLLSWTPLTGYDLKKMFAELPTLYWSGNNNQIYRTLVELHRNHLISLEVQPQADHPPRKVYTITPRGQADLRQWVMSAPEISQIRNTFLIQLAWADQLSALELDGLLAEYEGEVQVHVLMLRTQQHRNTIAPARTPREIFLWDAIMAHWIA
ncbi:MAG: PadR family transcriptional regulator, partial [Chloroflexi bacterium]|nr:PadR family transcriptional regulator [Chloroflexota bacterium]